MATNCETCKNWDSPPSSPYVEDRYGDCLAIGSEADRKEDAVAFLSDRGYDFALTTAPTFSCSLWEACDGD